METMRRGLHGTSGVVRSAFSLQVARTVTCDGVGPGALIEDRRLHDGLKQVGCFVTVCRGMWLVLLPIGGSHFD